MSDITYENKKSHSLRTFIILMLAITLTCVSLAMITEASWERSGSLMEAVIMSFLAGGVALSAHLLPALTKKRVGKFGWGIVSMIWVVAVLVTLYSHTVFFVSTMTEAGNSRANKSAQVQDIKNISEENKKLMTNTDARSVVAISRDIANIDIQINQLTPRACANCKRIKGNIAGLQAKKDALNIEMEEAKRVAALRDEAIKMDQKAAEVKNNARLDPVTEKLVSIFNGMNVDGITLFISVVNAALLEMLASLFWWLVWPDKKVIEPEVEGRNTLNKRKRPENILMEKNEKKLLESNDKNLLENKIKPLSAAVNQIIYNDKLIDKKNEDIFIDPYVSKIIPVYKETDKRKVNSNFIEEDINVISFVRHITPQYIQTLSKPVDEEINIQKFENEERPLSNLDSFFKDSFVDEDPIMLIKEEETIEEDVSEDIGEERTDEPSSYNQDSSINDNEESIEEQAQSHKQEEEQEIIEEIKEDEGEVILVNEVEDEKPSEIILEESNEIELEEVKNEEILLQEENKKTAGSDVVYSRPRFKPSEIVTVNIQHSNENQDAKIKNKEEEESKEVYKIETVVPRFGNDKMETDLKKITAQFSKKQEDNAEDITFEIPVLVSNYEEESNKSLYVNKRKSSTQESAPEPDDVLKDLFPEVDFINDLSKK